MADIGAKISSKYDRVLEDLQAYASRHGLEDNFVADYQKAIEAYEKPLKAPPLSGNVNFKNNTFYKYTNQLVASGSTNSIFFTANSNFTANAQSLEAACKALEIKINDFGIKLTDIDFGSGINLASGDTLKITGTFTLD